MIPWFPVRYIRGWGLRHFGTSALITLTRNANIPAAWAVARTAAAVAVVDTVVVVAGTAAVAAVDMPAAAAAAGRPVVVVGTQAAVEDRPAVDTAAPAVSYFERP